jgi:hypothetical protein
MAIPVKGLPDVTIIIDPSEPRIGLRVPVHTGQSPAVTSLRNVRVEEVANPGGGQLEVSVTDPELFLDAYPLLCAMADRIQLDGMEPAAAVDHVLETSRRLLARRERLPHEREIGLFGELQVLDRLISVLGPKAALASWRGPDDEEHDFGFASLSAEVKTTTSERREHWIESLTQLLPPGSRELWLVSIQLTGAGPDGGLRLPELVMRVRAHCQGFRSEFDGRLGAVGWDDSQADLYPWSWWPRGAVGLYLIDEDFPRLTPAAIHRLGLSVAAIREVRYRIDLTGRPSAVDPPKPLNLLVDMEDARGWPIR